MFVLHYCNTNTHYLTNSNYVQYSPQQLLTYINPSFLLHLITVMNLGRCSSMNLNHIRKSEDYPKVLFDDIQTWQHIITWLKQGNHVML